MEGAGGSGGPGCGGRGRRRGARTEPRPIGGRRGACGAWPGFETTRRAEGSRAGRLAGGPPPTGAQSSPARRVGPDGARNTSGTTSNNTRRGRLAGGPPPTSTHSGQATQAAS